MIDLKDIQSLSEFTRNARHYTQKIKESKNPVVLTVNGKAELVVQDAGSYQEMLERLERAEAIAAIRRGMAEFERGEDQDAREALENLRTKHVVPS